MVDGEIKEVSLSEYRGKYVILFWYPKDFTFVCPTEIIAFSDRAKEFADLNCQVRVLPQCCRHGAPPPPPLPARPHPPPTPRAPTQLIGASTDTPEVHLAWIKTARKRGGLGYMQVHVCVCACGGCVHMCARVCAHGGRLCVCRRLSARCERVL